MKDWLIESGFIQYQCQISISDNYSLDKTIIFLLYYFDGCVYWYTSESLGKWFVATLGKRLHVNFLGYSHWFISTRISKIKDQYISVYQARYAASIVDNYVDTATVKRSIKFYKTILTYDMIFTKYDVSTSDEKIDKLTMEFKIHYRVCIGSLIYLLSARVYLSFAVHKLSNFP